MAISQEFARVIADRSFWPYVEKTETCWLYKFGLRGNKGNERGVVRYNANNQRGYIDISAPRFSFILHFGFLEDELKVLHHCDNTICVKPDCLFKGTQEDNMKDMVAKGRSSSGEDRFNSKLTWEKVREIRNLSTKMYISHLAIKYKVAESTISRIISNKIWKEEISD